MLNQNWGTKLSKIKITFKNGSTYETDGSDKLLNVSDDRAIHSMDTGSLFAVRSNNIWITVKDREEAFIKTNSASPYYGQLDQGFKIEYFLNIDGAGFVKSGEYYGTDIDNSSSSRRGNNIEIQGADLLQYIGNTPVNIIGIKRNITIKAFLEYVFTSVGLAYDRYIIDSTLTRTLKYAYAYGDKLISLLNDIALSNMCSIYVDEDGKIRVLDLAALATQTTAEFAFDGNVNTPETILGTSMLLSHNAVRLNYINPTEVKNDVLLNISNIDIASGNTVLSEFKYSDSKKALGIDYVTVRPDTADTTITLSNSFDATQNSIIIAVNNPAEAPVKGIVYVVGNSVHENEAVLERYIAGIDIDKRKYFEINSRFIQTDSYAISLCDKVLSFIASQVNYVNIVTPKCHPLLRLGSIVTVNSNKLKYSGTCIVARVKRNISSVVSFEVSVLDCSSLL